MLIDALRVRQLSARSETSDENSEYPPAYPATRAAAQAGRIPPSYGR